MSLANQAFMMGFNDLKQSYMRYAFYTERDIEWLLQTFIWSAIRTKRLPLEIYNNFPMYKMPRRSVTADLAIISTNERVETAIELKYEPDHERGQKPNREIWPTKLQPSVVFWSGEGSVEKDISRVQEYVTKGICKTGISIFIDEGRRFRHRPAFVESKWVDWSVNSPRISKMSLLVAVFGNLEGLGPF